MKYAMHAALALLVAAGPVLPSALAQDAAAAPATATFPKDQLEQLVAPIALYPDSLLMQVLMAATYPLEIIQAQRFITANPDLTGSALEAKLKDHDWDPAVKSLCGFPDVLNDMGNNLDWTQDLGDAFLAQEDQLLDAVQIMRGKAHDAGNLKTSEQMVVTEEPDNIIVIESADPEVIYVPDYSSTVVYGGWGYPSYYYPPMYPYTPPGYGLLAFGAGMVWGAAIWGDCDWGWGGSDVNIDVDRQNNFNRNTNINGGDRVNNRPTNAQGGRQGWKHDASHRKGVNYRDSGTASKFGGQGGSNRVNGNVARGRSGATASQRPATTRPSTGAGGTRPSAGTRPSTGASTRPSAGTSNRSAAGSSSRSATRPSSTGSARSSSSQTPTFQRSSSGSSGAYSGSRSSSSASRSASSRGSSSRGSMSGGGGSRGGGGGSRGGGGGGGRR